MFENDANFWAKVSAILFIVCLVLALCLFGGKERRSETAEKIEAAYWEGYHDAYDELSRKYNFDFDQ